MNNADQKRIMKKLAKDKVCYVLITCGGPTDDGNMQVEMSYEGDAALASYLVYGAQAFFDEQEEETKSCGESKIVSLGG
jgi:hypothetical protein